MRVALLLGFAILVTGCDVDPIDDGTIVMSISASSEIATPSTPSIVTVTARNTTGNRVVWGQGSSSCQLSMAVITAEGVRRAADLRACTEDFVDQALAPGAMRTETFEFDGTAIVDGQPITLPAGTYRLIGNAGDKGETETIEVILAGT